MTYSSELKWWDQLSLPPHSNFAFADFLTTISVYEYVLRPYRTRNLERPLQPVLLVVQEPFDLHLQIFGFLQSCNNWIELFFHSSTTSGEWDSIMFLTASKSLVIHPLNPVRALLSWSICFVFIFNWQQRQIEENNTRNERSNHVTGHHVRFRKRWHTTTRHHITIWLQLAGFNCINRNKVQQLSTDFLVSCNLARVLQSHDPLRFQF